MCLKRKGYFAFGWLSGIYQCIYTHIVMKKIFMTHVYFFLTNNLKVLYFKYYILKRDDKNYCHSHVSINFITDQNYIFRS